MVTHESTRPFVASVLMGCWLQMWTRGAAEDDRRSRYEAETGFGSALFDARNGFNELNRYLMLWNVEPGKSVCIQPLPALGSLHG